MGACSSKTESDAHWREKIAKLVPLFIERHCDFSDPDAYTDVKVLMDVFEIFLVKQWDKWPPTYVTPQWCLAILKQECLKDARILFRINLAIGLKLHGLQNLW